MFHVVVDVSPTILAPKLCSCLAAHYRQGYLQGLPGTLRETNPRLEYQVIQTTLFAMEIAVAGRSARRGRASGRSVTVSHLFGYCRVS